MLGLLYAAVAYVRNPVGTFVEELRREFHPSHTHADAHITILPPRPLMGSEEQAIEFLQEVCSTARPFEITMGDVESFIPATPTVFIRVAYGAYRMRELHDQFNVNGLEFCEPWPYMPHLTIVKADTQSEAEQVLDLARHRWENFKDGRKIRIDSITFVKGSGDRWVDVAPLPLGEGQLVER
ncbi:MAG: 2'-5' RNA ligase family protein [Acetobacteraceae bacterium]|nr:2'-5' RNA ligase family protein [Acetobacteraceae bacterium]